MVKRPMAAMAVMLEVEEAIQEQMDHMDLFKLSIFKNPMAQTLLEEAEAVVIGALMQVLDMLEEEMVAIRNMLQVIQQLRIPEAVAEAHRNITGITMVVTAAPEL
jgi:hypothetical protein